MSLSKSQRDARQAHAFPSSFSVARACLCMHAYLHTSKKKKKMFSILQLYVYVGMNS